MRIAGAFVLFGLSVLTAEAQNRLWLVNKVVPDTKMNSTRDSSKLEDSPAVSRILPVDFELFDPPNLYLYHDYVFQGLPKFMTGDELSTAAQRYIFILHWSVRYFIVALLSLEMLY